MKQFREDSSSNFSMHSNPSWPQWNYDVFLSFRGEDTRTSFTDHLYAALEQRGFNVFRDDLNLERGKSIHPELLKAIQESRISLIILSENYPSSTWCLDELLAIVQCRKDADQIVLPVFYNVAPSEVRKQTGKYAKAFDELERSFRNDLSKVFAWRAALKVVANLSGVELKNRHETKLIDEIVEFVEEKLHPFLNTDTNADLVGMDSRLRMLSSYVDLKSNETRFVGISGMGGIGKTTIARTYYDENCSRFLHKTFLCNVREVSSKGGILSLQEQILCEILRKKSEKIWNLEDGKRKIKRGLQRKKVLIVIDDVDHISQLENLVGKEDWFGSGSRIIITTRDENLLQSHGVVKIYKVQGFNEKEASRLLKLKVCKFNCKANVDKKMFHTVVSFANGLPLALEVLGSLLMGKNSDEWKSLSARIKEELPKGVFDILRVSFDMLEEQEKEIFLDIACFFNGMDKDIVIEILGSCGFHPHIGMRNLVDRSLINYQGNQVWVHDLLREMGWKFVREKFPEEPSRWSRLWLKKDIFRVFRKNQGTEDIEALVLDLPEPSDDQLSAKSFSKMNKLRLLILHNVGFFEDLDHLSNDLKFLVWHGFPLKSLPLDFEPVEIAVLDLCYSKITQLWTGVEGKQRLSNLKVLNLSHSENLVKLADLSWTPNLEKIILEGCMKLCVVDPSIGDLKGLIELNLKDCKSLAHLPNSVCGLTSLKILNVSGCSKLETLEPAECLEELDVSGSAVRPSFSFFHFKNFRRILRFHGCKYQSLWKWLLSFWRSENLGCALLPSFSGFHYMIKLDLSNCKLFDESIPNDIGNLSSLIKLNLSGNNFCSLPASFCGLSRVEHLNLNNCKRLHSIPAFPYRMKYVTAQGCPELEALPVTLKSCSLQEPLLNFANCFKLFSNQGCYSILFTMLMRYLQGQSNPRTRFRIIIPGSVIPSEFKYRGPGSFNIQLPPFSSERRWVGIAICVKRTFYHQKVEVSIHCRDGSFRRELHIREEMEQVGHDHLCLFFLSRYDFSWIKAKETDQASRWIWLKVKGKVGGSVESCGFRIIYESDCLEFDQNNGQLSSSSYDNCNHLFSDSEPLDTYD